MHRAASLTLLALLGCASQVGDRAEVPAPAGYGAPAPAPPTAQEARLLGGSSGLRRLTRMEYDNTLRDLLGDTTRSGFLKLPEDANDPFDNDHTTQTASGVLIDAVETLAAQAASRLIRDPARRAALVGCAPRAADDAACLRTFVSRFGRRAFRRPLLAEEIERYVALRAFGAEAGDFYTAVELVIRAMLQDPSFLYRVELGQPVPGQRGVFRLDDFEVATRLSYFLWGSAPSDELLDRAQAGKLLSPEGRRAAAAALLRDRRGQERVSWFHAFWLGYRQLPVAADLAAALRMESDKLVDRVVFGQKDYFALFTATDTFIDDRLARHYDLPRPGPAGAWVPYGNSPRRGILSHGTVLSVGAKFEDTSPTLRGIFVRERLLCDEIPPPPPSVAADEPPEGVGTACKVDRYREHASGGCASCHERIDPIGFGLEAYDRAGRFRSVEKDMPSCKIPGEGELEGLGPFKGPGELGALIVKTGALEGCVMRQLYRFAMGRKVADLDQRVVEGITERFKQGGRRFQEALVDLAASPAFIHRRLEE